MNAGMTDIVLERVHEPPLGSEAMQQMAEAVHECFDLHRVTWHGSMLSADGRDLVCHFRAPDADSARIALTQIGADITGLWPATVIHGPDVSARDVLTGNVAVTRRFPAPVAFADVQEAEDRAAACLETHRVRFLRTFFSADRRRMICVYCAPDAESVRLAQREAQLPVDKVWAFRRYASL